jgi:hypothetical protein
MYININNNNNNKSSTNSNNNKNNQQHTTASHMAFATVDGRMQKKSKISWSGEILIGQQGSSR